MKFNILTYNNGVGIVTDAILLKELIYKNISDNVSVQFIEKQNLKVADIGIWIQNFDLNLLNLFKKNIFFINEEWAGPIELNNLHCFDHVVCKSAYAKKLLSVYCNVIHLPFISNDYYNVNIRKQNKLLHFAGKSIQKNTELILQQSIPITLIDPSSRYNPRDNFSHINTYQSVEKIISLLNEHDTHICCSLYESWGHYLFEGLSTGADIICSDIPTFKEQLDPDLVHFIPTTENIDYNYLYDVDNINKKFPLRKSFYVDVEYFTNTLNTFVTKGTIDKRKSLFDSIINKNSKEILNFFKSI